MKLSLNPWAYRIAQCDPAIERAVLEQILSDNRLLVMSLMRPQWFYNRKYRFAFVALFEKSDMGERLKKQIGIKVPPALKVEELQEYVAKLRQIWVKRKIAESVLNVVSTAADCESDTGYISVLSREITRIKECQDCEKS